MQQDPTLQVAHLHWSPKSSPKDTDPSLLLGRVAFATWKRPRAAHSTCIPPLGSHPWPAPEHSIDKAPPQSTPATSKHHLPSLTVSRVAHPCS